MAGARTRQVRGELRETRRLLEDTEQDLEEAERYIRDLERNLAELDGAVVMAAVHGWGGGFGPPCCARCHGRGQTWRLDLELDLPVAETCESCGGDGRPGPCIMCGRRHTGNMWACPSSPSQQSPTSSSEKIPDASSG